MADGSRFFNLPQPQRSRLRPGEIVVDLFAAGGGASEAIKQAIGVDPTWFRAQGFSVTYIIDRTADGKVLKTTALVRMCGNSVSPPPFYVLIAANLDPVTLPLADAA